MTKSLTAAVAALLLATNTQAQTTVQPKRIAAAHIGLVYPISTNGTAAHQYTNAMSFHAIAGISSAELSFCAAGVTNIVLDKSQGVLIAGFSNHVRNRVTGLQAAGFMNTVRHHSKGVQAAGFLNISGHMKGAQLSGFVNIALDNVKGFQGAGFYNLSMGKTRGAQIAGFMNNAGNVAGVQLAGFMNTAENVNTQAAGFINKAKKVKGVQLSGFMNIADSSDYPIGFVNIVKKGYKSLGITMYDGNTTMATFRSGGRVMYGVVGMGINHKRFEPLYALEGGIGANINISKLFRVKLEGTSTSYTDFEDEIYLKSSLRILPAVSLGNRLELFAGPTINSVQSDDYDGKGISNNYIWSNYDWGTFNGLYIGFAAGMHFHL